MAVIRAIKPTTWFEALGGNISQNAIDAIPDNLPMLSTINSFDMKYDAASMYFVNIFKMDNEG